MCTKNEGDAETNKDAASCTPHMRTRGFNAQPPSPIDWMSRSHFPTHPNDDTLHRVHTSHPHHSHSFPLAYYPGPIMGSTHLRPGDAMGVIGTPAVSFVLRGPKAPEAKKDPVVTDTDIPDTAIPHLRITHIAHSLPHGGKTGTHHTPPCPLPSHRICALYKVRSFFTTSKLAWVCE
ncbi:hypothetical protein DM02DRAFT_59020 [Periconia macrospinosa]|uniref:Uncharacterized protein n=1 Tax=Periconia macrospinosa TaxID=97972 RepID=A0A2V1DJX9_9PLEO|nr:hypothetical protein DM02DRAFT_59020 [Periconia macrospinosa]